LNSIKKRSKKEFSFYENYPPYKLEDVFKFHFKEMPADLKKQQVEYEKFLNWMEARK